MYKCLYDCFSIISSVLPDNKPISFNPSIRIVKATLCTLEEFDPVTALLIAFFCALYTIS